MSEPAAGASAGLAVIGMAGRFPGAATIDQFWANLRAGVESIARLSDEELAANGARPATLANPLYVKAAPLLDGVELFDAPFFGINRREAEILDPQQRLFIECAWSALESAGYVPERAPGTIGLFAGAGMSAYLWANLSQRPDVLDSHGFLQVLMGNEKDYLASRTAYALNLRGPCIGVQTACSTSLVAVHLACQALLDYHCDMALAGAVRIAVPQALGYFYEEGEIGSPDGHCRSYDARAGGTLFGSGVGVVLLKRLDEAVADGDPIRAVIRGTAVNNDGIQRVGFSAPGVDGQMAVIAEALAAAGIDADTIGYVEGHGTATQLGDPVEVEALTRAYRAHTRRRGFCALGSVKSNLGHLDAAAGIAGLIKAVLTLEHGQIPPSLHYDAPNPRIDFAGSPFYVNDRLRDWPAAGGPRRAAVSSFGMGGTNAHLVLEQAPPPAPPRAPAATPAAPRPWQVLTLSARTAAGLERAAAELAARLREPPAVDLADTAFTLLAGRRRCEHRRAVVCRDAAAAAEALAGRDPGRVLSARHGPGGERSPVFLFPGQGAQHPGMGGGLYAGEPVFRREIDRCAEILRPALGLDLRDALFPPAGTAAAPAPAGATASAAAPAPAGAIAAERLRRTDLAQAALFAVEYALARLWMSWGVAPRAMLGHSIGEYVAACLAGVFSLADALALVAARGRLLRGLPPGAMLSVPLAESATAALLAAHPELDLAAVNGAEGCVLSGPVAAVESCRAELERRGLAARRLHTAHAFHSRAVDPVVEPFAREVEKVALAAPAIPYVSNLTGTWVRAEEATDPRYWARHLRQPVRFAVGLETLLAEPGRVLIETGPGETLAGLARRHPALAPTHAVVASLHHPAVAADDQQALQQAVARLWLAGVEVDPAAFYAGQRRRRVPLPTYPFERLRYWIDPPPRPRAAPAARADDSAAAARPEDSTPAARPEGSAPAVRAEDSAAAARPGEPAAAAPGPAPALAPPVAAGTGSVRAVDARRRLATEYVPPRDERERQLVALWEEMIGVAPIGVHDDFFELGGHSLLATRIAAAVRARHGASLLLRELFATPTVAEMAAALAAPSLEAAAAGEEARALPELVADPDAAHLPFPLTDVQGAYLIGRGGAFDLGGVATHSYFELDSEGIDLERFGGALRLLIARHGMLRAVMLPDGRQQVLPVVPPYQVEVLDLAGEEPDAAERQLLAVRERMSHQVLPADRWPLFEVRATRLGGGRLRFHVSFDFLIGDAWSVQLLGDELRRLYRDPAAVPPPPAATFRDYVLAAAVLADGAAPGDSDGGGLYRRAEDYWTGRLDTLPPAPELPLVTAAAGLERVRFVRRSGGLAAPDWARLAAAAAGAGLTPSAAVLAAFAEVLAAWSKSPRFILNLTLFHRLPLHPDVDRIVGDFTSLTLLEIDGAAAATFAERARRIQRQLWDDLDHRFYSGVRVLRDLARRRRQAAVAAPVVFTSMLTLRGDEAAAEPAADGLALAGGYGVSQTPQVWLDHQVSEQDGALSFAWDAVEELFPTGMLDDMLAAYRELLGRLAGEEAAWQEAAPLRVPAAHLALHAAANATATPLPAGLLHGPFLAQAALHPERPAVLSAERRLSYGELRQLAADLGRRLLAAGVAPGTLVAVVMSKGWEQAAAALGALAAGAAYLPIDAELPDERRDHLLRRGEVRVALTQPRWAAALAWPPDVTVVSVETATAPVTATTAGATDATGAMTAAGAAGAMTAAGAMGAAAVDSAWPEPPRVPGDLAYTIFTSGSTGEPKGVMVEHAAALNTVVDVNRRFGVGPGDRVLAVSSLSFDLSVYDLFGILGAGGAVVIPEAAAGRDPARWLELMTEHEVTVWNSVPALLEMLVEHAVEQATPLPASLRLVLLSGDWVPVGLPNRVRGLCQGEVAVVSLGGATEAAIWSILYPIAEVDPAWRSIPYGRAMANQTFEVLDGRLGPRPLWVPGELYIGGAGLARGYWRDEEKTAAAFVTRPPAGERLYRTGDLGRWLPDGNLELLGREDFQVKIHGHRVELGEIEAALARCPGVRLAVAAAPLPHGDGPRGRRLVGYVVPEEGRALTVEELRSRLAATLPAYMVPAAFVVLDALPLTANGKVDRNALPAPPAGPRDGEAPARSRTPAEELLAAIWEEVLGVAGIGGSDDFYALGGDSLLATLMASRVRERLGIEVSLRELLAAPTLAAQARAVEAAHGGWATPAPPLAPLPRGGEVPLSFAQERLWFLDRLQPGNPIYNEDFTLRLAGPLDRAVLAASLAEVVRRHEVLRTCFAEREGMPVQVVGPAWPVAMPLVDLAALPAVRRLPEALRQGGEAARRPFDLGRGPLLRAGLWRLGPREHLLLVALHHIVCDAWSMGVLLREMSAVYAALRAAAPLPLLPLALQYADYALWQRHWLAGEVLADQLGYWRRRLAGPLAELRLPARPRPGRPSFRAATCRLALPGELTVRLEALSRRAGATMFMTLLAALKALLHRYSGQDDIVVGSPIANRNRLETEPLIGYFANTVALRTDLAGNPSFRELLTRVRETAMGAYAHQDVPFERVVEELRPARQAAGAVPFFRVMFVLVDAAPAHPGPPGLDLNLVAAGDRAPKFDLTLWAEPRREELRLSLTWDDDLFDAATAAGMLDRLGALLAAVADDPGRPVLDVPLAAAGEEPPLAAPPPASEERFAFEA